MSVRQAVLLVEDSDSDALLVTRAFEQAHIESPLFRVRDGVEALDYLFARGTYADRDFRDIPAVILLDLNLPRLDGIQVLKAIRENPRIGNLPIVMLTSSSDDQDRLQAYDSHVNSFIRKPVSSERFIAAIKEMGLYWLALNESSPMKVG